jgi:hypothetical protein
MKEQMTVAVGGTVGHLLGSGRVAWARAGRGADPAGIRDEVCEFGGGTAPSRPGSRGNIHPWELGLEAQVIGNREAVLVLPAGINKATALEHALRKLGLFWGRERTALRCCSRPTAPTC